MLSDFSSILSQNFFFNGEITVASGCTKDLDSDAKVERESIWQESKFVLMPPMPATKKMDSMDKKKIGLITCRMVKS